MTETLAWSLRVVRRQSLLLVRDLLPEQFVDQALPGEHHPAWVLGHLLLADSYLLYLLGNQNLPSDFPDLLAAHGPKSTPLNDPSPYLAPPAAIERLERTGKLRCEAVADMAAMDLQRPMPDAALAVAQPTIGHHLQSLVFHEGHHSGQLAAWRRHHALEPAPWVFSRLHHSRRPNTGHFGSRSEPESTPEP